MTLQNTASPVKTENKIDLLGLSLEHLSEIIVSLGEKGFRARQLAEQKERTYEDALTHLLTLMKQGWAAKEKGL